eukprot:TRINITY_DN886_c0_g1_i2.p1 TRINITY_DN886_c0_g1~~TRINITY_DN886_c0_g1_i2.p1  ORF type:complete len:351 (-),score=-22.93 TRINITY_DN886_c0_g1_i2:353-1405(-)
MLKDECDIKAVASKEFRELKAAQQKPRHYGERLMRFPSSTSYYTFPKNRYGDVLPREDTRVLLHKIDGVEGSDYINANWISSDDETAEQKFIACQAPLPTTFVDFWRMVVEVSASVIVMLTGLTERGRVKAHAYYPTVVGETQQFGCMSITLTQTCVYDKSITIRVMKLTYGKKMEREVVQLHYTDWPDFGTPKATRELRILIGLSNYFQHKGVAAGLAGPIVSHCSAGLGRTGTYVGAHMSLSRLQQKKDVNIKKIVTNLRRHRDGMVQTKEQYSFIYQTVFDTIKEKRLPNSLIEPTEIEHRLSSKPESRSLYATPSSYEFISPGGLSSSPLSSVSPPVLVNSPPFKL